MSTSLGSHYSAFHIVVVTCNHIATVSKFVDFVYEKRYLEVLACLLFSFGEQEESKGVIQAAIFTL
jgi:hypothetical protein